MTGAEILIAGALVSAYGAYSSSQAQASALERQAELREQQAFQSYLAGEREARLITSRGEKAVSSQIAGFGQSGTRVAAGSSLMFLEDTVAKYKEDALAVREAAKYRSQNSMTEAEYDRISANDTRQAGYINIAGSLLSAYGKSTAPGSGPTVVNNYYGAGSGEFG